MSSSTDDTINEGREERLKELSRLRHLIRKKRALKLKKNSKEPVQIISMPLSDLRRISNSKTKERPKNLKERLVEYLKKQKYIEDVKAKLEKKEKQKMEERYNLDFNEDRTKVRVKDLEQERRNEQKKINKKRNIPIVRQPLRKRSKKGIDKNGNIIKSYPYKDKTSAKIQPITQTILDIDQIVEKCASEFKASIKNAIEEYAYSVKEPDSVNNKEIDDSISKESQKYDSTNDEVLTPYSDLSSECDQPDIVTQKDENLDIQDSNYMKVYLAKGADKNLYHIDHEKSTKSRLEERKRLRKRLSKEKDGDEENNEKLDKLIEERYQNLEMGRKIFENAYRFFENSEDDDEVEKTQQVPEKVSVKRRSSSKNAKRSTMTKETFSDSQKELCELEQIKIEINMDMVDPTDIYLSSLPQYEEIRTEVLVPKCWIDDDVSTLERSVESDDDATFIISPVKDEIHAGESSNDRSVPADSQKKNCNGPQFNIVKASITDYVTTIRKKYEKEQSTKEKNRNYQALEEERIQCQRRINRELEFLRTLTTKKHSKSFSSENTDDDGFEKSISTVTEVSGSAKKGKRNDTKRSSSPILIYHYYRLDPKLKEEITIDANANCIPKLEADNPSNLTTRPRRGPQTPPPQDSSSDGEIHDDSSEEWEHNKDPSESVEHINRVAVLKQSKQEETTRDPRLQNIDKSKTSNETSKIHYETMTITRSFDNRSTNKSKL